jgi:hypothetical protein
VPLRAVLPQRFALAYWRRLSATAASQGFEGLGYLDVIAKGMTGACLQAAQKRAKSGCFNMMRRICGGK